MEILYKSMKHINWTKELIADIIKYYEDGYSPCWISDRLGFGKDAVWKLLKRLGVYAGRRSYRTERKYAINDRYFQHLDTPEKAYWLGFLAADGCMHSHRLVSLELKAADTSHLQKFLNALDCNKPIYHSEKKGAFYSKIMLNSSWLVDDLKILGIHPRKSSTLQWPKLVQKLLPHYIRGYFDGDGTWHKCKNGQLMFNVTGSPIFIPRLQDHLVKKCQLRKVKLIDGTSWKTLQQHGNKRTKRIYDYIYKGATVWLSRKREIADSVLYPRTLARCDQ